MISFTLTEVVLNQSFGAVTHAAEIPYVYGQVPATTNAASRELSVIIMDYWISFAVSLDPNDGKGTEREYPATFEDSKIPPLTISSALVPVGPRWPQYKSNNQVRFIKSPPLNLILDASSHVGAVAARRR